MTIVYALPPNIEKIMRVFPIRSHTVLFAWGDRIYNPARVSVPDELVAHESVHGKRQVEYDGSHATTHPDIFDPDASINAWWDRYLVDQEFRLSEEVLAHRAEMDALTQRNPGASARRRIIDHVAMKLRGEIYAYAPRPTFHEARLLLVRRSEK